jgi:predicted Na+-dependent transporter
VQGLGRDQSDWLIVLWLIICITFGASGMLSKYERTIACWLLVVAITCGYTIPGISEIFEPFAFPALFLMIILSLVPMARLDVRDVFSMDRGIWTIVLWQLFVLPTLILAGATWAKINPSIINLMIVTASAGSLFASPTFADLLKLNKQKALQCMILSTFMMPLSYFIFFSGILHEESGIDLATFVHRCSTYLLTPVGLFLVYMSFSRSIPLPIVERLENLSRRLTILTLIVFGLGICKAARDLLWTDPGHFAVYLVIVTTLGASMAYLTAIVMYRHGITDAMTASIVSGFRNVGLGFALLPSALASDTAAYVGISQVPIFLAPLVVNYFVRAHTAAVEKEQEDAAHEVSPLNPQLA